MDEIEAITGLIAIRTTIDTLDGLSQNEEEFTEGERETLSEAQELVEGLMDELPDEAEA